MGGVDAINLGRRIQADIYGAGVYGRTPVVPVEPGRLREAARKAMSDRAFAYVDGSAGRGRTNDANVEAFGRYRAVPRMLRDVRERDLGVDLFGRRYAHPLLLAPIGVLEMAHPRAERAVAKASVATQTPMIHSTQASVAMEEVAAELGETPHWYQLYWSNDDDLARSLVQRAEACGAEAVVVTLDTHLMGWRPEDLDLGHLPFARGQGLAQYLSDPVFMARVEERAARGSARPTERPTPAAARSLVSIARHYPGDLRENLRSPLPGAAVETFLDVFPSSGLTWDDLAKLREWTSLPILLKGIQSVDDVRLAADQGLDGIVVSNHGGRQVDGAVASLDVLASLGDEVGDLTVLFDSGVRSGSDVFTALALGADAVILGRPYVYGLALAGAEGVQAVVEHTLAELDLTMALTGHASVAEIHRGALAR